MVLARHPEAWVAHLYKPVGRFVLDDHDIPEWARENGKQSWKAGDLAFDLHYQICYPDVACFKESVRDLDRESGEGCPPVVCSWEDAPRTYILRRHRDHWHFVDTFLPNFVQGEV